MQHSGARATNEIPIGTAVTTYSIRHGYRDGTITAFDRIGGSRRYLVKFSPTEAAYFAAANIKRKDAWR